MLIWQSSIDVAKKICRRIMSYDTVKCHVNELLELEFKYIMKPNIYDWKRHFKYIYI